MVNKKKVTDLDIITYYMEYVLEFNNNPKTIKDFCIIKEFDEVDFYEHFNSFNAIEKAIFKVFCTNTISVLNNSEDYHNFDARNKLLSFYYTFFENLTANRTYVEFALNQYKNSLKSLKLLSKLRKEYLKFINSLGIETLSLNQEKIEKLQAKTLQESAWLQLLFILKFWLDDTSKSYEKTDVFIEKSVNTSFDLLDTKFLKSALDLSKFIYAEKIKPNF